MPRWLARLVPLFWPSAPRNWQAREEPYWIALEYGPPWMVRCGYESSPADMRVIGEGSTARDALEIAEDFVRHVVS